MRLDELARLPTLIKGCCSHFFFPKHAQLQYKTMTYGMTPPARSWCCKTLIYTTYSSNCVVNTQNSLISGGKRYRHVQMTPLRLVSLPDIVSVPHNLNRSSGLTFSGRSWHCGLNSDHHRKWKPGWGGEGGSLALKGTRRGCVTVKGGEKRGWLSFFDPKSFPQCSWPPLWLSK